MERMEKPKFIKEIEKSEGKERAKCGRWYIRVYGELDHKPMVELESLEIVVKELHKLEEENKNLKEYNGELIENHKKDIAILCEENKKLQENIKWYEKEEDRLREENDRLKNNAMEDMRVQTKLEEEIRFLEECLDNKEKVNKSLREELDKIKSTYVYDAKQVRDIC